MLLLLARLALAEPWLALPAGEDEAEWASALAIAGATSGGGVVRVRPEGDTWLLSVDGPGGHRAARVPRPASSRAREDVALLAASLLGPGPAVALPAPTAAGALPDGIRLPPIPTRFPTPAPASSPTATPVPAHAAAPVPARTAAVTAVPVPRTSAQLASAGRARSAEEVASGARVSGPAPGGGSMPDGGPAGGALTPDMASEADAPTLDVAPAAVAATPDTASKADAPTLDAASAADPRAESAAMVGAAVGEATVGEVTAGEAAAIEAREGGVAVGSAAVAAAPDGAAAVAAPADGVAVASAAVEAWPDGAAVASAAGDVSGTGAVAGPAAGDASGTGAVAGRAAEPPAPIPRIAGEGAPGARDGDLVPASVSRPAHPPAHARLTATVGAFAAVREGLDPAPGVLLGGRLDTGVFATWVQLSGTFAGAPSDARLDTARLGAFVGARIPGRAGVHAGLGPAVEALVFRQADVPAQVGLVPALTAQVGAGLPVTEWLRAEVLVEGGLDLRRVELARDGESLATLGSTWGSIGLVFRVGE